MIYTNIQMTLQETALKMLIELVGKGINKNIYTPQEIIMFNGCVNLFLQKPQPQPKPTNPNINRLEPIKEVEEEEKE